MPPSNKKLTVKPSTLPGAGLGLFANTAFAKGDVIVEYTGRRTTWANVENDVDNVYIYHMNDDTVIDARKQLSSFGRYANDAAGLTRVKGITNNAEYTERGDKVYIIAKKNIQPGAEIFVAYGPGYWKQVRINIKLDKAAELATRREPNLKSKQADNIHYKTDIR